MAHIRSSFPNKIRHPCRHCKSGPLPVQFYTSVELLVTGQGAIGCSCTGDTQLGKKLSCSCRSPYAAILVDICEVLFPLFSAVFVYYQLDNSELKNPKQVWENGGKPVYPPYQLLQRMREAAVSHAYTKNQCSTLVFIVPV